MIAIVDVGRPGLGLAELFEARVANPDGFGGLRGQQEPVSGTGPADDGAALATVVLKQTARRYFKTKEVEAVTRSLDQR